MTFGNNSSKPVSTTLALNQVACRLRKLVSKSKKLKVKIKESELKIKPQEDGKPTENLDTVYYYIVFELFEC